MKTPSLILLMVAALGVGSTSFASNSRKNVRKNTSKSYDDEFVDYVPARRVHRRRQHKKKYHKIGLNFYAYYDSVSHLSTTTNSAYTTNQGSTDYKPLAAMTGEYNSSSSVGLGLDYAKPNLFGFWGAEVGFNGGASYEFDRTINRNLINNFSTSSINNSVRDQVSNPSLNLTIPHLNATISYGDSYAFAGINYVQPNMSNSGSEKYEGKIGYQAGFGSQITSWMSLEAVYRIISFDAKPDFSEFIGSNRFFNIRNIEVDKRQGLGILDNETLEMSGMMLNLKFNI